MTPAQVQCSLCIYRYVHLSKVQHTMFTITDPVFPPVHLKQDGIPGGFFSQNHLFWFTICLIKRLTTPRPHPALFDYCLGADLAVCSLHT